MSAGRAELTYSGQFDLASWWSEAGLPGFSYGVPLANGLPWVLAGHVMGGWSMIEPGRAIHGQPPPGVTVMQTPLVWYDSVTVVTGEGAAWQGFGSSLATAYGWSRRSFGRGARSVLDLRNGGFEFDENALSIERGDSLKWFRGEAVSGNRGVVEAHEDAGRHLWGVAGGLGRGPHRFEGAFSHRAASAALHSGDEQAAGATSGSLAYRYRIGNLDGGLVLARSYDFHQSFGALRSDSRRDAQEFLAAAELLNASPERTLGARAEFKRTLIKRHIDPFFERGSDAGWFAARYLRPVGAGVARVELGAGRHAALEQFGFAPSVSYRIETPSVTGRLAFERLLAPVWADLAPRELPFMQSTWAGVLELGVRDTLGKRAQAGVLLGRTENRALVTRMPLDDLWLRIGATPDFSIYNFAVLSMMLSWEGRRFGAGTEGFAMVRTRSSSTPEMDPGKSVRVWGAWGFNLFRDDLRVTLRGEVEGVGARESQGAPAGVCGEDPEADSRRLPAYATGVGKMVVTIADAVFTVQLRNLENRRREEIWYDCQTGTEALTPAREWRFALTALLFD